METCVCVQYICVHLHVSACAWPASMQTDLCIKRGIYVKVLIFSSHFLLMFKITVSRQEFLNSGERNRGEIEWRRKRKTEIGNFFMALQRQTLIITTPFVLMFSLS